MKSPVRENCTPGSVRGLLGNWQSYRNLELLDVREGRRLFCLPSHVPKFLSLLLLLRPALHWEGRSGDGLSAYIDDVAA